MTRLTIVYHNPVEDQLSCRSSVIELKSDYISLPSGMLQEWPVGSPITLHTLASLMSSISNNTATNALIDVEGIIFNWWK
ncbi:MAG: serine hydrolase [Firmicutes bacterium]|nr:serine hydrolase [Bacillota bacterium]